ncbi:unnamed protein product [Fraxinus pennsylvanica]|uniref:HMA domain-containing protein n=1 Tax=Fraxinus pennsylvanica TaxID=56036 RepID=A0AAD1ZMT8_9LAMI|nr:unnamed protein product [Fraxinus pennsylvanica]
MPKVYDDWERLVEAVLKREELRSIALDSSRDPSFNSSESSSLSFGASYSGHDPDFDRFPPSFLRRHDVNSKSRTTAGYESKKDLHDSSISLTERDRKAGHELKEELHDSSISLSYRGKTAGYEWRENLHDSSISVAENYKKKVVIEVLIKDDRQKRKAMKAVRSLPGIDSLSVDMKEKKVTIVGDFDPIHAVNKLRKMFYAEIISIGPAKERETEEDKIEVNGRRKDQIEVDERKRDKREVTERINEQRKVDERKSAQSEQVAELVKHYKSYFPYHYQSYNLYYYADAPEDDPKSCVIC